MNVVRLNAELRSLQSDEAAEVLNHLQMNQPHSWQHNQVLAAFDGDELLGAALLHADPSMNNIHIEALKVDEFAQHRGVAKALLEHVFEKAAKEKKAVTNNGYSDMGKQHLVDLHARLAAKHGVTQETWRS